MNRPNIEEFEILQIVELAPHERKLVQLPPQPAQVRVLGVRISSPNGTRLSPHEIAMLGACVDDIVIAGNNQFVSAGPVPLAALARAFELGEAQLDIAPPGTSIKFKFSNLLDVPISFGFSLRGAQARPVVDERRAVEVLISTALKTLSAHKPSSRERSLTVTKLEEARFWLLADLEKDPAPATDDEAAALDAVDHVVAKNGDRE